MTDGQFAVDVEFRTTKSWSPFWGHNCSNAPKSVMLKVSEGDQELAVTVLDFTAGLNEGVG